MDQREKDLQAITECFGKALKHMHKSMHIFLEESGLTGAEVEILFKIAYATNGLSVKELAHQMHLTSGAITQYTNVLVQQGLLSRTEDPKDRRIVHLHLTAQAQEQLCSLKHAYTAAISPLFQDLSDTELAQLLSLMQKVGGCQSTI